MRKVGFEKRIFICEFCEAEFFNSYALSSKKKLRFCSKYCKTKAQITGTGAKIWSKQILENQIKTLIKEQNRYLVIKEILLMLRISSKTLAKYKVSILNLNKEVGFNKPKSLFEKKVYNQLKTIFSKYTIVKEKSYKECKSPKGYPLRFDFYIKELNILVEADGTQHYIKDNIYYSDYCNQCDDIKNKFAWDNNIKLVRIKYKSVVTEDYIRNYFN